MSILSSVLGFMGAKEQSKANDKVLAAQTAGTDKELAFLKESRDLSRADNEPRRQVSLAALGQLGALYGISQQQPVGGYATSGGSTPQASAGDPYSGYLAANPDLAAEAGKAVGHGGRFGTEADYLNWHDQTYASEGRPSYQNPAPGSTAELQYRDDVHAKTGVMPDNAMMPGNSPAGSDPRFANFFASPDYQFRLSEGDRNLQAQFGKNGLSASGAFAKAASDYGQKTASAEFGNYYNRLSALADTNQVVNNTNQSASQFFASGAVNATAQGANNTASAYEKKGDIWSNFYGGINQRIQNSGNAFLKFGAGG